ncbi:MAG: phosphotransferase family protein [Porticoccaceae bacterium]
MITQETLQQYFSERLGTATEVTRFKRTFPGISRETFLVWTREAGGAEGGYIFRADSPGGPVCPVPLEFEWKVMSLVHKTSVPVPEPLWFDAAPEITEGRPVMVRVMVEGSNEIPGLYDEGAEAAARRQRVACDHAEKLATLHSLDFEAWGFSEFMDVPSSPALAARHDFDTWTSKWRAVRSDPMPMMTEAASWLEEHLPTDTPRLSLCKGQNGMGEEIWKDDKLVALSDWELALIGDPCQDWALSQGMLTLADPKVTLGHYRDVAGFELNIETLDFYRVWEVWRTTVVLNNGLRAFLEGRDTSLPRITLCLGRVKLFEQLLAMIIGKSIPEAAAIVHQWRKSPYRPENAAA